MTIKDITMKKHRILTFKGLTMLEMIISLSIIAVLFAVVLPQFRNIENSWASKQANAETLQNGRILIDYLNRNLSKAVQITDVSDPCDATGYIEFVGNDTTTYRCQIGADDMVEFGPVGNLSILGGPVSQMQFTCYDAQDLDTPITTVDDIRSVKIQITVTNGGGLDQTFTTQAYLRTNASSASALVAHWKFDEGSGTVAADSGPNGCNGTIDGATWISGDSCPWLGGAARCALNFDGDNDFVDIDTEIADPIEEVTIALWLKLNCNGGAVLGEPASIISNDSWGVVGDIHLNAIMEDIEYADLEVSISDTLPAWAVYEIYTEAIDVGPWTGLRDDRWHHVAIVLDSDRAGVPYGEIWVDAQLLKAPDVWPEPYVIYPGVVFGNATIGAWNEEGFLNRFLPGAICDMRIYNQCLNQQQIAELAGTRAGLAGYWKFDETSGPTAYDWSGNNYDADVYGAAWETNGQIDGALDFDGTDDYVDTGIWSETMIDVTFCMWFKSDDAGSIGDDEVAQRFITQMLDDKFGGQSRFALGINNNKLAVYWHSEKNPRNNVGEGTTTLSAGQWYHAAVTYNAYELTEIVRVYLNGNEEYSFVDGYASWSETDTSIQIGRDGNDSRYFDGLLDEVRIYQRELTEAEVQAVYNQSEYCCSVSGAGGGSGEILP